MSESEKNKELFRLKKEIDRLKKSVKKQRYGLVWMDIPEAFEDDVENKLPILKEVPDLAIKNDDGKPQHILIEGNNYHALTCLNYTHKGKIDVIYIDPPYNTGSDGFRYKDKRIISKFPDGTEVPKDHPFRHSYWLSFMRKRLELSWDLLRDGGTIFISIDDNEVAQLKLLGNEIFREKNFVGQWNWFKSATPPNLSHKIKKNVEYILAYEKNKNNLKYRGIKKSSKSDDPITKPQNSLKILKFPPLSINFKLKDSKIKTGIYGTDKYPNKLLNELIIENGKNKNEVSFENRFVWTQNKLLEELKNETVINCSKSLVISYKKSNYSEEVPPNLIDDTVGVDTTEESGKALTDMFGKKVFDYPKPISLMKYLISFKPEIKDSGIILDFFAGTGTTGHAVLDLNSNNSKYQFILVTDDENNICTDVCLPRLKKAIKGYKGKISNKSFEPLGNSLKYYKTAFIGKNNILAVNDEDKIELAHNAGELLAIAENTLELVKQTKYYQLFENNLKERSTTVYFREELDQFDKFVEMVEKLNKKTTVYVFSWGNDEFIDEFEDIKNVKVKTIPLPILEIYKNIYNLEN